jgi:hypothetical protein
MLSVENPKERRTLGRPRSRRVYKNMMDLEETKWGGIDCIGLAQDRE